MNINTSKRILRKIQALTDNLEDQGKVSSLERDLLLSYIRDLYESVIEDPKSDRTQTQATETLSSPIMQQPTVKPVRNPELPRQPESPEPPAPEPQRSMEPQTRKPEPEPKPEAEPTSKQPEALEPEPVGAQHTAQGAKSSQSERKFQALFTTKESGDLVDKLQTQAITSIQSALGINERLMTINVLFDGDTQAFDKTVAHLNGLHDFAAAQRYLIEGAASKYGWDSDEKAVRASEFIQIVRRKYL